VTRERLGTLDGRTLGRMEREAQKDEARHLVELPRRRGMGRHPSTQRLAAREQLE